MRLIYTVISCFWIIQNSRQSLIVYVVPTLDDITDQDGTLDSPFSSIIHARDYLRQYSLTSMRRIALYPTYHFLNTQPLMFDYYDSFSMYIGMTDKEKQSVSKQRKRDLIELDVPIISGGIQLKNWINDHGVRIESFLLEIHIYNDEFFYYTDLENNSSLSIFSYNTTVCKWSSC